MNHIRLLRLFPHEDERSSIRCQLVDYPLIESDKRTHPYDAISYAWGESHNPATIFVSGQPVPVTRNLYSALLSLRYRYIERVLWIDALCINQNDDRDKEQQIGLMPMIYGKANCVVVWLGISDNEGNHALEQIYTAKDKSIDFLRDAAAYNVVSVLLQRPWFRRIWVLQEVAAARNILIKCGDTEISGEAFCTGLNAMREAHSNRPGLDSLDCPITYLMEGAILKPKFNSDISSKPTLNICSLGELLDKYHTFQASLTHDRVYALLGMCSDSPGNANLLPDYQLSWDKLLKRVINFILGQEITVHTWEDSNIAVIEAKGYVLGKVQSVQRYGNRQDVDITLYQRNRTGRSNTEHWNLPSSAKSIQIGDLLCLFQGTSRPTIVRISQYHFSVIVIAAICPESENVVIINSFISNVSKQEYDSHCDMARDVTRDFTLLWEWESTEDGLKINEKQDPWEQLNGSKPQSATLNMLAASIRLWNVALILGDVNDYPQAEKNLSQVRQIYIAGIQASLTPAMYLPELAGEGHEATVRLLLEKGANLEARDGSRRTPLLVAVLKGCEATVRLLLEKGANLEARDGSQRTSLMFAAEQGHEDTVRLLLRKGAYFKARGGSRNWTPLMMAAARGHKATVRLLLEKGANLEARDSSRRTPLILASEQGHEATVRLLLQKGANFKIRSGEKDQTPLMMAAAKGHEATVRLLLEKDTDLEARDDSQRTPLMLAVDRGHETTVQLLLEKGADFEARDGIDWNPPLIMAAEQGHEVTVRLLLEKGANREAPDRYERTPLMLSADRGHEAVVRLLLEKGANLEARNGSWEMPLTMAASQGHEAIIRLLLEKGADLEAPDGNGWTPLMLAAEQGHEATVRLLLEKGANFKIRSGKRDQTPLMMAAAEGHEVTVRLLLEKGADFEARDGNGWTPLMLAAKRGHETTVRLLLEEGANLEIRSGKRAWTSLMMAATRGHEATVRLLLERGADPEARGFSDETPLISAAKQGHEATVRLLLEKGADLKARDGSDQTPLMVAAAEGHKNTVRLLQEKGGKGIYPTE